MVRRADNYAAKHYLREQGGRNGNGAMRNMRRAEPITMIGHKNTHKMKNGTCLQEEPPERHDTLSEWGGCMMSPMISEMHLRLNVNK